MRRGAWWMVILLSVVICTVMFSFWQNQRTHSTEPEMRAFIALPSDMAKEQRDSIDLIEEWDLTKFHKTTDDEFAYLLSLQDENGLIAQTPRRDHGVPYFANMAALAMLSREEGFEPVERYMDWYLKHINRPDRFGMVGTIYDYRKVGTDWLPTYSYDSADSYAATFLSLVYSYTQAVQSSEYARHNLSRLVEVAEVLIRLQDDDGLIWAKPNYPIKFLMDNAENYRGLWDASHLMRSLGRSDLAERYAQAAYAVYTGIETRLWLEDSETYAWALYGRLWRRAPRKRFYPDTVAQIYPIVFGLLDPDSERAKNLYGYLNTRYPEWTSGHFDDRFPWTVLGLVATMMEDDGRAVDYLDNVLTQMGDTRRNYPWHAFESAFFMKTWNLLGKKYAPVTATLDESEEAVDADVIEELDATQDEVAEDDTSEITVLTEGPK